MNSYVHEQLAIIMGWPPSMWIALMLCVLASILLLIQLLNKWVRLTIPKGLSSWVTMARQHPVLAPIAISWTVIVGVAMVATVLSWSDFVTKLIVLAFQFSLMLIPWVAIWIRRSDERLRRTS